MRALAVNPRHGAVCIFALATLMVLSWESPGHAASQGSAQDGRLVNGFEVPLEGPNHRFLRRSAKRGTQHATLELAVLLWRSAQHVAKATPGPPLLIGDCSLEHGGAVERHQSHRSGRDVDLLFYVTDAKGHPTESTGFEPFDSRGMCSREGCDLRLDRERNWSLLRTLIASRRPAVQYIFVSNPIKKLLLKWAHDRGEHPDILRRARLIMRQPSDSAAHDDHMHVRTFCSASDLAAGCVDGGTRWRWVDDQGRAAGIR
jgi:penicillin-insensitive murein endopeptidase